MITRTWRGWTTPQNAPVYERLLLEEILPAIAARLPEGYRGHSVNRREAGHEVEFLTTLWFDNLETIRAFAGEDVTAAHVPDKARAVLHRWEGQATHYQLILPPPDGLRSPADIASEGVSGSAAVHAK